MIFVEVGVRPRRRRIIGALSRAIDAIKGRPADEARDALANLPLTGVLFLAMIGTPGERANVDSPLVLVLDAIRDTIDGGPHAVVLDGLRSRSRWGSGSALPSGRRCNRPLSA